MIKFLESEPEDIYHSRSKSGEFVSSHLLALFKRSPWKYYQTITGQHSDPDKPEYIIGRAAHKLILEGDAAFNESYTVADGPMNPKTGMPYGKNTKAYTEWAMDQTGDVISVADFDEISAMAKSCREHSGVAELLGNGTAEGVVRAKLEDVDCQIRIDYFNPAYGIIDLKTCRDIDFFEKDCRDYGYVSQLAFYQSVLHAKTGVFFPVSIIAVDKTDFHIAGRFEIAPMTLNRYASMNKAALIRLKKCRETGNWETGFERTRIISEE